MANNLYSELDSVNDMLEAINEQPAATLEDSEFSFAIQAHNKLRKVALRIQKKGWQFNKCKDQTLSITVSSTQILVPTDTINVEPHRFNTIKFQWRGAKLFNPLTNDFKFTTSPRLNITIFQKWDDTPMSFREYATALAVREYESTQVGNPNSKEDILRREADALGEFHRQDLLMADVNILNLDPAYGIARVQPGEGAGNRWEYRG